MAAPARRRGLRAALLGVVGALAACSPSAGPPPDILLVTIDTLRADHVLGGALPVSVTPHIDALAAEGVVFGQAIATSTVTVPSHASIMTSRYPRETSVGIFNGSTRLEGTPTLAERLREAGYATGAFVGNAVLRSRFGLARGFDVYDDELPHPERNRPVVFERTAEETVARAIAWLEAGDERPRFLWVHLQDPHGPYTPPERYAELPPPKPPARVLPVLDAQRGPGGIPAYQELAGVRSPRGYARRYAQEVAYADHGVGRLVARFREATPGRPDAILVTADHGESLGEYGFFFQHGHSTTPELARVPLVLVAPGVPPGRRDEVVSLVDVMPTLLALAGLPVPADARGLSLVRALRDEDPLPERVVLCDIRGELALYGPAFYARARGRPRAGAGPPPLDPERGLRWQAFALADGGAWRPGHVGPALQERTLRYLREQVPVARVDEMPPAQVERLRALGYLPPEDGDGADAGGG